MKKAVLFVLLLFGTLASAAPAPNEYPINVHVDSSYWRMAASLLSGPQPVQRLAVIINGKKYELEAPATRANPHAAVTLLALGDYKAKLVQDVHKTTYESFQAYEFLFPDKKTRKFFVVGQTE